MAPPILDYEGGEFTVLGGQAVVATAFTAPGKALGNTTTPARDWGQGSPNKAYARVTAAFNNLTSLDVQVVGADDTAGTNFVPYVSQNFALAALVTGALLPIGFIPPGRTKKQFLLGRFVVNGAAPTLGRITLGLIDWMAGPSDGFSSF